VPCANIVGRENVLTKSVLVVYLLEVIVLLDTPLIRCSKR
jgi:hypothetical protein